VPAQDFFIMVVDDEDSIRSILYETLASEGYNVVTAASAEEALELLNQGELPHIIMTDIRMPGMNGVELAMHAKKISDEIEIIIMTSHASLETAQQAIRLGVYDYINKPFSNLNEVKTLVLRVIDKIYLRLENRHLMEELQKKNDELTNANEEITAISEEITAIYQFGKELLVLLDTDEIIETFLSYTSSLLGGSTCVFLKYFPQKTALVVRHIQCKGQCSFSKEQMEALKNVGMSLGVAGEKDIVSIVSKISNHPSLKTLVNKLFNTTKYLAYPLIIRDTPLGVTLIVDQNSLDPKEEKIVQQYLNQFETSYDKALLHRKIKDLAIKDGLTELYNHRYFKEKLDTEIQVAKRLQHPVSLIFFDIDHFKSYNDINGHPMGDMLLRSMADILRKLLRTTDIPCRYGGEEFGIILPHTSLEGAMITAEKIRKTIEITAFPNQEKQPNGNLTISIGVAEAPSHADESSKLISVVDEALYKSKTAGRNMVTQALPYKGYTPSYTAKQVVTGPSKQ
jgi:two-component system, cell cycle response regulator